MGVTDLQLVLYPVALSVLSANPLLLCWCTLHWLAYFMRQKGKVQCPYRPGYLQSNTGVNHSEMFCWLQIVPLSATVVCSYMTSTDCTTFLLLLRLICLMCHLPGKYSLCKALNTSKELITPTETTTATYATISFRKKIVMRSPNLYITWVHSTATIPVWILQRREKREIEADGRQSIQTTIWSINL